jgi:hypothetical protein
VKHVYIFLAFIALIGLIVGCTTTKGNTFRKSIEADQKTAITSPILHIDKDQASTDKQLTIETVPPDGEIYFENVDYGKSPVTISNLDNGTYKLRVVKENYEDFETLLTYNGENMTYRVELVRLTGFIEITVEPANAEILFGDESISIGTTRVPVGSFRLDVRLFGYEEYEKEVEIRKGEVAHVSVELSEATFSISSVHVGRKAFNPDNAGLLGQSDISFYVSAPGKGSITIKTASGNVVFTHTFDNFKTWAQNISWNGKTEDGSILPDGTYGIEVSGSSLKKDKLLIATSTVNIDRSIVIAYQSVFSGCSGLLFCPSPLTIPGSGFELASLFTVHGETQNDVFYIRAPSALAARYGLSDGLETDIECAVIPSNYSTLPFLISASVKYKYVDIGDFLKTRAALYTRASYHNGTGADTFTAFTGVGFGLPVELKAGAFSLILCPELEMSPYKVTYSSDYESLSGFYSWLYFRGGILFDSGSFSAGASITIRSIPFNEGFGLNLPIHAGLEAYYMIPDTQLFLSGVLTTEYESNDNYFISGGLGLGFIF